jgi:muconate cycloisomerase
MAAAREQGFRHVNFKAALTPGDPGADVALGRAVREAVGPDGFVWADANQGYQLHDARRAALGFHDAGVDVLEQPLPADQLPLMQQLRAACPLALAVDEASVGPADFLRYVSLGLVDYLVVKLARSGGVWPTVQQIAIAEAAGLPLLVSGLTESLLSKVAACQVAAAFGFAGPAALNGSQFVDESALYPAKAQVEQDGQVHLGAAPGIGVQPNEAALRELDVA